MDNLPSEQKIIISGLIPSDIHLQYLLAPIKKEIKEKGHKIVGELFQYNGVKGSRKPVKGKPTIKSYNSKSYISSQKAEELKGIAKITKCDLIIFLNDLSKHQINHLENHCNSKVKTIKINYFKKQ